MQEPFFVTAAFFPSRESFLSWAMERNYKINRTQMSAETSNQRFYLIESMNDIQGRVFDSIYYFNPTWIPPRELVEHIHLRPMKTT